MTKRAEKQPIIITDSWSYQYIVLKVIPKFLNIEQAV